MCHTLMWHTLIPMRDTLDSCCKLQVWSNVHTHCGCVRDSTHTAAAFVTVKQDTVRRTHPPSPSKFTPFCLEGLVQYMSLSADPRALLCMWNRTLSYIHVTRKETLSHTKRLSHTQSDPLSYKEALSHTKRLSHTQSDSLTYEEALSHTKRPSLTQRDSLTARFFLFSRPWYVCKCGLSRLHNMMTPKSWVDKSCPRDLYKRPIKETYKRDL